MASTNIFYLFFIVFFPLVIVVGIAGLLVFTIITMLMLYSFNSNYVTIPILNLSYQGSSISQYMMWYILVGFIWTFTFITGINEVTIAGAIAQWYWTRDKTSRIYFPVTKAFYRTCRYHLGSVAVGSLLITIIEVFRLLLWRAQRMAKKSNNKSLQYLLCCCQCCMGCVAVVMKFVNRNAYICIAVTGKAFFKSAAEASGILLRNALRLVAVDFVADFILFISKLCVTALCAVGSYLFLIYRPSTFPNINFPFITVAFVAIIAYMVSTAFFSIFHLAVDTIFFSFLEDSEKNDGSNERPFFMSDNLKKIIGAKGKNANQVEVSSF